MYRRKYTRQLRRSSTPATHCVLLAHQDTLTMACKADTRRVKIICSEINSSQNAYHYRSDYIRFDQGIGSKCRAHVFGTRTGTLYLSVSQNSIQQAADKARRSGRCFRYLFVCPVTRPTEQSTLASSPRKQHHTTITPTLRCARRVNAHKDTHGCPNRHICQSEAAVCVLRHTKLR